MGSAIIAEVPLVSFIAWSAGSMDCENLRAASGKAATTDWHLTLINENLAPLATAPIMPVLAPVQRGSN